MAGMKLYSLESNDPPQLGPYRLLRRIATGGMGRIYLARQAAPGTDAGPAGPTGTVVDHGLVAVKTLLAEGFVSKPDRERFAREVELAGRVESAYTATVLDANAKAERPWLAIEFIPAPSLGELVVNAGTLPADAVRWVAAGAARALVELHGRGVVHRDIKPLNVLLPHDGPRLIDFGISHAHDHTSSTTTIGTFAFTSPEQACGKKSTAASDMYSLGATLFFLAVGRSPYEQTDHSFGILALVQRGELDTDGLPPELEPLILPLLRVDPESRPSPSDVLRDVLADVGQVSAEPRLPQTWTALIEEYAEQGRQLRDGTVDFAAAEAPTQVRPEGTAERADEAISEMREQLEALRKQRDALVRAQAEEQAEAEARELARQEEEERRRREQARKEEAERRERERKEQERKERERKEKERKERERKERERKERQRSERERERIAREKTETAAKNKSTSTTWTPKAPPKPAAAKGPAKSSGSSEGVGALLLVALVIGALIWHPWDKKDDDTPKSSPSSGVTLSSSSGTTSGDDGSSDDDSDSGTDSYSSSSSSSSSSGGLDDTETEPEPETTSPEPEPDPTEEAFKAVSYGDCLDVVDTGYGGTTKYDWSEEEPNTTSCGYGTRVKVTGTTGDCPTGVGKATWSYYSTSSGERTELCLTGQYRQGDCLLAKHEGNTISSIAMLSSPNCTDRRVPVPYNEILVVTDIYRATGAGAEVCRHGQYDSNTYWSTEVDDGATQLCVKAYD
ncbi:protein kinase [Streptomyces sp. NBS 14/10]|uniref:protein kinase domain-containing protein n=1 Tax=Streptomyces sp. NBS 14/10 TaxID=1945643 RepID=UPI000B7F63AC|nr:protein kinase [Streptomyces sp. NBS 14/10]KAK1185787.1 protein kinase [Streptomyces sp. NBS 14/10]